MLPRVHPFGNVRPTLCIPATMYAHFRTQNKGSAHQSPSLHASTTNMSITPIRTSFLQPKNPGSSVHRKRTYLVSAGSKSYHRLLHHYNGGVNLGGLIGCNDGAMAHYRYNLPENLCVGTKVFHALLKGSVMPLRSSSKRRHSHHR